MKRFRGIFVFLFLLGAVDSVAAAQNSATSPRVGFDIQWVDWPSEEVAIARAADELEFQDPLLARQLGQGLQKILRQNSPGTVPGAEVTVQVRVNGFRVVRKYTDSLFGSERNRPAKYSGIYQIEVLKDGHRIDQSEQSFSIDAGRTVGNRIAIAQAKVRGMVEKRFEKLIKRKRFRALLVGPRRDAGARRIHSGSANATK